MLQPPHIVIFGAGCIGCYLAGVLLQSYQKSSDRLTLIGRESLANSISEQGLTLTDYLGYKRHITQSINIITSLENHLSLLKSPVDILLVTIKCNAVKESLEQIAKLVNDNTVIVCLQNGIGSELPVVERFTNNTVITGIVGFNSVAISPTHFHRGTEGEVLIEKTHIPKVNQQLNYLMALFDREQLPCALVNNIAEIRWGKLLLNLNNAINALADIPLKAELNNREYRQLLSKAIKETLLVLKKANITPAKLTSAPPKLLPYILILPNRLFTLVANKMLAIDPLARSSMWHDLSKNKQTEIDYINGAVVSLAKTLTIDVPINKRLVQWIKHQEINQQGSPRLPASKILSSPEVSSSALV